MHRQRPELPVCVFGDGDNERHGKLSSTIAMSRFDTPDGAS
jgi:hypothetical protein